MQKRTISIGGNSNLPRIKMIKVDGKYKFVRVEGSDELV